MSKQEQGPTQPTGSMRLPTPTVIAAAASVTAPSRTRRASRPFNNRIRRYSRSSEGGLSIGRAMAAKSSLLRCSGKNGEEAAMQAELSESGSG